MSSRANAPNPPASLSAAETAHAAHLIDLWDAWLSAEADASLALGDWSCAPDVEKSDAYTSYRAALDREEQAALVLERCSAP
jgi:hypothetical protein